MIPELEEYIKANGKHFTPELTEKVLDIKWSGDTIQKFLEGRVYYNVTGSSLDDIVFWMNYYGKEKGRRKSQCWRQVKTLIEDYRNKGKFFDRWITCFKGFRTKA